MRKRKEVIYIIVYSVLCACLYYLMSYISYYTMEGDKTDILISLAFGFIPIGLFIISFIYGLFSDKILAAVIAAFIVSVPIPFLPIMSGNRSVLERMEMLFFLFLAIFFIVIIGFAFGVLVRILFRRLISIIQGKKENT